MVMYSHLTYWLNGRWFLQIGDIHVGNFNIVCVGGMVMFFLHFMLFQTFLEKQNSGNKKKKINAFFFWFLCGGGGWGVLASEPVGGRSRATELPCYKS